MQLFNGLVKKKRSDMKKQYGTAKDYEKYESQAEAEEEFLRGNLSKEIYEKLEI